RIDENVRLYNRGENDVVRLGPVVLVKTEVRLAPDATIVRFGIAEEAWRLADATGRRYHDVPHPEAPAVFGHVTGSSQPSLFPGTVRSQRNSGLDRRIHSQRHTGIGFNELSIDKELLA